MDEARVQSAAVVYERLSFRPEWFPNDTNWMERIGVGDLLFVYQLRAFEANNERYGGLWRFVEQ